MPSVNKPNVQVTFEGLQTVFVGPKDKECTVGVLANVPQGHDFAIRVLREDASGTPQLLTQIDEADIKPKLTLTVSNATQKKISLRKMDVAFNRQFGPTLENEDSFRWVLDLESDVYSQPIGAEPKGFATVLQVNAGELVTRTISQNDLTITRPPNIKEEIVGRVATKSGIDIVLDKPTSRAVFKNGDDVIFTADWQSRFHITFARICAANQGGSDAEAYYTAVGHLIPDKQKIRFSATGTAPSLPNDSDARCMGCSMSRSKIV